MSVTGYQLRVSFPREEDALGYKYDWTARAGFDVISFKDERQMAEWVGGGVRKDLFGDEPEFWIPVENDDPATVKEAAAKLKKAVSEWLDELKGAAIYSLNEKTKELEEQEND